MQLIVGCARLRRGFKCNVQDHSTIRSSGCHNLYVVVIANATRNFENNLRNEFKRNIPLVSA